MHLSVSLLNNFLYNLQISLEPVIEHQLKICTAIPATSRIEPDMDTFKTYFSIKSFLKSLSRSGRTYLSIDVVFYALYRSAIAPAQAQSDQQLTRDSIESGFCKRDLDLISKPRVPKQVLAQTNFLSTVLSLADKCFDLQTVYILQSVLNGPISALLNSVSYVCVCSCVCAHSKVCVRVSMGARVWATVRERERALLCKREIILVLCPRCLPICTRCE